MGLLFMAPRLGECKPASSKDELTYMYVLMQRFSVPGEVIFLSVYDGAFERSNMALITISSRS